MIKHLNSDSDSVGSFITSVLNMHERWCETYKMCLYKVLCYTVYARLFLGWVSPVSSLNALLN